MGRMITDEWFNAIKGYKNLRPGNVVWKGLEKGIMKSTTEKDCWLLMAKF